MPAVKPTVLINAILDAIQQSGGSGIFISDNENVHPRRFIIQYMDQSFSVWAYIWTLTPGGRPSLPNEYRIQMTSVTSPLQINPNGYTILLGYHQDLDMLCGFDLNQHLSFTVGSPSVQIDIGIIHSALQNGFAFKTKENFEIVIGIRKDHFINYIINSAVLHQSTVNTKEIEILEHIVKMEDVQEKEIVELPFDRQVVVKTVKLLTRNASFRQRVLTAYDNRCAVTRAQLRLLDAAHILPVLSDGSTDQVANGIALSPTMHRAYDNCLIYLNEDLIMKVNEEKVRELISYNLNGGIEQLRASLNTIIHLPADKTQRPNIEFIKAANRFRRIPGYF